MAHVSDADLGTAIRAAAHVLGNLLDEAAIRSANTGDLSAATGLASRAADIRKFTAKDLS